MTTNNNVLTAGIAAMYMPCKITDKYANGVHYDMVGVSEYEGMLQVKMPSGDSDWWNIDICKLILKPISEISDEHRSHCLQIIHRNPRLSGVVGFTYFGRLECHGVDASQWKDIINYLRSKQYDVDGLIQQGIAITHD